MPSGAGLHAWLRHNQLINFAHGEVVMIGAMVALYRDQFARGGGHAHAHGGAGRNRLRDPVLHACGYAMERMAYRPLRGAPRLAPLISAIGVSIILQHLAMLVWSRNVMAFPQIIPLTTYRRRGDHHGRADRILGLCFAMMQASPFSFTGHGSERRCVPPRRIRRSRG